MSLFFRANMVSSINRTLKKTETEETIVSHSLNNGPPTWEERLRPRTGSAPPTCKPEMLFRGNSCRQQEPLAREHMFQYDCVTRPLLGPRAPRDLPFSPPPPTTSDPPPVPLPPLGLSCPLSPLYFNFFPIPGLLTFFNF